MLFDWGSWDGAFNELTASVCRDLVASSTGRASTSAYPCRAAAPSPSKRRSARWCPRAARCSCRTTAATASASCASWAIWGPRGRGPGAWRTRALRSGAHRRRADRGSLDHACRAGALRDRHGNPEPPARDRGRRRQARPRPDRRCHEFLRGDPHRRRKPALRCADRSVRKNVSRRPGQWDS